MSDGEFYTEHITIFDMSIVQNTFLIYRTFVYENIFKVDMTTSIPFIFHLMETHQIIIQNTQKKIEMFLDKQKTLDSTT